MQKIGKVIFLSSLLIASMRFGASALENVSINQLIEQEDHYDKTLVTVQGEAIGEPLRRGDECWVNIDDGTNSIGIKMKGTDAQRVQKYGSYKQRGDTVQVKGYFYKACPEDGGETDIHAVDVQIVSPGKPTPEDVPPSKIAAAAGLAVLMVVGLAVYRWKRLS